MSIFDALKRINYPKNCLKNKLRYIFSKQRYLWLIAPLSQKFRKWMMFRFDIEGCENRVITQIITMSNFCLNIIFSVLTCFFFEIKVTKKNRGKKRSKENFDESKSFTLRWSCEALIKTLPFSLLKCFGVGIKMAMEIPPCQVSTCFFNKSRYEGVEWSTRVIWSPSRYDGCAFQ